MVDIPLELAQNNHYIVLPALTRQTTKINVVKGIQLLPNGKRKTTFNISLQDYSKLLVGHGTPLTMVYLYAQLTANRLRA